MLMDEFLMVVPVHFGLYVEMMNIEPGQNFLNLQKDRFKTRDRAVFLHIEMRFEKHFVFIELPDMHVMNISYPPYGRYLTGNLLDIDMGRSKLHEYSHSLVKNTTAAVNKPECYYDRKNAVDPEPAQVFDYEASN